MNKLNDFNIKCFKIPEKHLAPQKYAPAGCMWPAGRLFVSCSFYHLKMLASYIRLKKVNHVYAATFSSWNKPRIFHALAVVFTSLRIALPTLCYDVTILKTTVSCTRVLVT